MVLIYLRCGCFARDPRTFSGLRGTGVGRLHELPAVPKGDRLRPVEVVAGEVPTSEDPAGVVGALPGCVRAEAAAVEVPSGGRGLLVLGLEVVEDDHRPLHCTGVAHEESIDVASRPGLGVLHGPNLPQVRPGCTRALHFFCALVPCNTWAAGVTLVNLGRAGDRDRHPGSEPRRPRLLLPCAVPAARLIRAAHASPGALSQRSRPGSAGGALSSPLSSCPAQSPGLTRRSCGSPCRRRRGCRSRRASP